jgi:hypothetical protein
LWAFRRSRYVGAKETKAKAGLSSIPRLLGLCNDPAQLTMVYVYEFSSFNSGFLPFVTSSFSVYYCVPIQNILGLYIWIFISSVNQLDKVVVCALCCALQALCIVLSTSYWSWTCIVWVCLRTTHIRFIFICLFVLHFSKLNLPLFCSVYSSVRICARSCLRKHPFNTHHITSLVLFIKMF